MPNGNPKQKSTAITGHKSSNQKWRKIILLLPLLLLFVSTLSYSQTLIPKHDSKLKWGYVNEIGKVVIKHKYDEAREFSEGVAAVMSKDKKGLNKWGFIDNSGKEVIPLIYDGGVGDFSEGLARVKCNGKLGWIDRTGKETIPLKYDETSIFFGGMAMVKIDGKVGFIDRTGKEIIPVKYDEIGNFSEDGLAKVKNGSYWGFIDKTGKEIIPVKFFTIGNFSEDGLAKVQRGNSWGYIDKTGKEIIPIEYGEIGSFSKEGLAKVKGSGNSWWAYGFVDKAGKLIIPLEYYDARDFSNGYAVVKYYKDNRVDKKGTGKIYWDEIWGVIDETGKEVLPGEYLEREALDMISDRALLQKEVQRRQKEVQQEAQRKKEEAQQRAQAVAERQQKLINKYGETVAKNILAGSFEIGMTKSACREITDYIQDFEGWRVRAFIVEIVVQSASGEMWKVIRGSETKYYLYFIGDKLERIVKL